MKKESDHHFNSRLHVPISHKLMNLKLALRQLTSNKRQYMGTIIIVAILMFFMMSMTVLTNNITTSSFVEALGGINPDIQIELKANFKRENILEIKK